MDSPDPRGRVELRRRQPQGHEGSLDDAAGLGISTQMDAQTASYNVAEQNTNNGIAMSQTADGALGQMKDSAQRLRAAADYVESHRAVFA